MQSLLFFAVVSYHALAFAAPYPPTANIPLLSLYHYCSPPNGPSLSHSIASTLSSTFCTAAASRYHPNIHGEVEIRQDDGLYLRAWWDASAAKKEGFEDECAEAVGRIIRGCQHEGNEERFFGGVSDFSRMGGKVEVGFE
jgi:hypothetical protein